MNSILKISRSVLYWSVLGLTQCVTSVGAVSPDDANMPSTLTRTAEFSYGFNGLVSSETLEPVATSSTNDPNVCLNTTYQYDPNGNRTGTSVQNCKGVTANAFSARSRYVAYDTSNHQFPISTTNALYQTDSSSLSYDGRFGVLTSGKDANNLVTSATLDELGRTVQVTAPDTSYVTTKPYSCLSLTAQGYDASDTPSDSASTTDTQGNACGLISFTHPATGAAITAARYVRTQRFIPLNGGTPQGPSSIVYYDVMGREIGQVATGIDLNNTISFYQRVLKAYDLQGRQSYVSIAHKINTAGAPQTTVRWSVSTFDAYNRPYQTYTPDDSGIVVSAKTYESANLGTVVGAAKIEEVNLNTDGEVTSYLYSTLSTSVKIAREKKNALGQLTLKEDSYTNQIAYSYYADGSLAGTKDGAGNTSSLVYDIRGNKKDQFDPDLGHWTYSYNALGELITQTDALGAAQTMSYDALGRLTKKVVSEYTANYVYDQCFTNIGEGNQKWLGALCQDYTIKGTNTQDYTRTYSFDTLGRTIHTRTTLGATVGSRSYDERRAYDPTYLRLDTLQYPTGVTVKNAYTTNGFVVGLNRVDTGTAQALWTATGTDSFGNLQSWQLGNGLVTTLTNDVVGRPVSKTTAPIGQGNLIQNQTYQYNVSGDLSFRNESNTGAQDTFTHDALHRLIQWVNNTPAVNGYTVQYSYDGLGNITQRSDRGSYTNGVASSSCPAGYTASPAHALTTLSRPAWNNDPAVTTNECYDANGSLGIVLQNGSQVRQHGWTSFHQPDYVNWTGSGAQKRVEWLYGTGFQRIQETHLINSSSGWTPVSRTVQLHPDHQNGLFFEQIIPVSGTLENRHYLSTPVGVIGMLVTNGEVSSGTATASAQIRYWHTDHLGSLTALSNDSGTVLERSRFDPFGQQLDAQSNIDSTSRYTDRGFTGHQELADLGLIHMNARLFDPLTGKFLSADSHITNSHNLQSFNRFSYCFNNPMGCTDPTGHDGDLSNYNELGGYNDLGGYTNYQSNSYGVAAYTPASTDNSGVYGGGGTSSASASITQSIGTAVSYSLQSYNAGNNDSNGGIDQSSSYGQVAIEQNGYSTQVYSNDYSTVISDNSTGRYSYWNNNGDYGEGSYFQSGSSQSGNSNKEANQAFTEQKNLAYFGIDDVIFSGGGAAVGIIGQGVGDLLSRSKSSWQDYAGSAIGGAAGGEALLYTGPIGAGAIGGLATNLSKQGLKNATGTQIGFDSYSAIGDTLIGTATGFIPGAKINGITAGKGNYNSIYKQIVTKANNDTILSITTPTAVKMFVGRSVDTALIPGAGAGAVAGIGESALLNYFTSNSNNGN
jgi:RHS repeat-associated protein